MFVTGGGYVQSKQPRRCFRGFHSSSTKEIKPKWMNELKNDPNIVYIFSSYNRLEDDGNIEHQWNVYKIEK